MSARFCAPLLIALLGACSVNPPLEVATLLPGQGRLLLEAVPFYPQEEYQCGPAALAGVLGAAGVGTDPGQLAPQVYLPGRRGSLQVELMAAARRAGRIPYPVDREPAALAAELQAQRPVLVLQNLQTPHFPAWHYAVLVGMDGMDNRVFLNSGTEQDLAVPAPAFLRTWDWAERWGLVVLRPGELPAQADPQRYAEAVAAFEAVAGPAAAVPAWQAAEQRWPLHPTAFLALGNQAYASGQLREAARAYARGLAGQPADPALANNLATVLGELGCPETARRLLEPVLARQAPDSGWRTVMVATRSELASRPVQPEVDCSRWEPDGSSD